MKQILILFILINASSIVFGQKECECFNGIGSSEKDKPSLTIEFSNGIILTVCGYEIEKKSENEIVISEFNVFDCKTGKSLIEYGAVHTCNVKSDSGKLIITELKYLPAGENWEYSFIPISQEQIMERADTVTVSATKSVYEKIDIDQSEIDQFINELEKLKGKGYNEQFENIIWKLTLLVLNGNSTAKSILFDFRAYFNCELDGALSEQWNDATSTVLWLNK